MSIKLKDTISEVVNSSNKLYNTRKIWGQNFNGESNVDGTFTIAAKANMGERCPNIYLGHTQSWNGQEYPTLYSGAKDKWVMHINPHIARCEGSDTTVNGALLRMESLNNNYYDLQVGRDSVDSFMIARNNSTKLLTILSDGNVGIGITSPSYKLHVNGTIYGDIKMKTPRTVSLTGAITGSGSFDGSANLSINTTVNHSHDYLPLAGGSLTGKLTVDTGNSFSISLGTYTSWAGGSYPTIKSNSSDSWVMLINPHICADDMNNFAKTSCIRMESPDGNPWDITAGNNGECSFKISEYSTSGSTYIRNSYLRINNSASNLGTLQVNGTKHPIIYGNGTYLTLGYTDAVSNSDYGIVIEKNDVRPTTTNTRSLGLSNYIWTNIFSNSCNINYGQFNKNLVICKNITRALVISSASWTWEGLSSNYPIIYTQPNSGTDNGDRYTMIAFPHIPYLKKSTRSYTGNTFGSIVRYESDATSPASFWDCGVISSDVFGIRRETSNYFTIGSDGGVAFRNNKGSVIHINANSTGAADVNSCIEFFNGTAYIDWHYKGDTGDFTTRLIESSKGTLTCNGSFNVSNTLYIGGQAITFVT